MSDISISTLNDLEGMRLEIDENVLTIPELHGFLSAMIIGPEIVQPWCNLLKLIRV